MHTNQEIKSKRGGGQVDFYLVPQSRFSKGKFFKKRVSEDLLELYRG